MKQIYIKMGRTSKKALLEQQLETPTKMSEAQYELDREFLKYLEEHAIINKCGYEFKSDNDKKLFYEKYANTINFIRIKFGLNEIQLSKSTLERADLEKGKKRGRKAKQTEVPVEAPVEVPVEPQPQIDIEEIKKILNDLAVATNLLIQLTNKIVAVSPKK